jgi:mono/diheme cytochrome c family protein
MAAQHNEQNADSKLIGLLAQFDDPDTLVNACDQARQDGYRKMDAYSPFPVHGIDPAIGIPRTKLPFFVLAVGLGAMFIGVGLQFYVNGGSSNFRTDDFPVFPGYRFNISGKPMWSLPANIPVVFEIIVLSSAFASFFGMWILNTLPRLSNPLHRISRFKRATNDRFFLVIDQLDPRFDRADVENKFNQWGATAIEEVRQDLTDTQLPNFVKLVGVLGLVLLLVPPVMIYRSMGMTNRQPRLHFMPDMDWQDKFKAQVVSPNLADDKNRKDYLFADLRAARDQIPGTIARGDLDLDSEYYRGIKSGSSPVTARMKSGDTFTGLGQAQDAAAPPAAPPEPNWVTTFPPEVNIDAQTLARGKQRFEIYCSACHGYAGNGNGLVNTRAMALNATGQAAWTSAKSLHDPTVKDNEKNPVGRIFDTITNGRGTMGPYRRQIPVEDRWAIVAYVKALQATGIQPESGVAAEAAPAKPAGNTKP